MAGFEPQRTLYELTFDELPCKGLEITVRSASVRERIAFDQMRFADVSTLDQVKTKEENVLRTLAERIVSWNMDCEVGYESLLDLEDPAAQQIVSAWIEKITGTPASAGKEPVRDPMEDSLSMQQISDSVPNGL